MLGYVHTGYFNLDLVYGQTYRAIEGSVVGDSVASHGTYSQTLFGVRPSFGIPNRFQIGLNFLKVKDDTSSIEHGSSPRDNVVTGPDLLVNLDNNRIELRGALAFSILTQNTAPGAFSKTHIDTTFDTDIPLDPKKIEKWLIFNDSTTPLDPRDLTSLAYNVTLKLRYFKQLFQVGYKSIGSEYYSLGNTFLRRDIRGWFVSDRMRFFRNRLYLTLGLEDYDDNFSESDGNPSMDLTTYNVAISYFPGPNLPRASVSFKRRLRDNGVDSLYTSAYDSIAYGENNLSRDYSVQLSQDFNLFEVAHTASLSWMSSDRVDQLQSAQQASSVSTDLSTDIKVFSLRSRYASPLTTTANYAWNENVALGGRSNFKYRMFDAHAQYKFLAGNFTLHGGISVITASGNSNTDYDSQSESIIDYNKKSIRAGAIYRPNQTTYFLLDISYIRFTDKGYENGVPRPSYHDVVFRTRFEKRF